MAWRSIGQQGHRGPPPGRAGEADAIIVDRMLPGMDGLTIIEALRRDGMRTPVLVLSALAAVDDRVRGLRSGGDDYLTSHLLSKSLWRASKRYSDVPLIVRRRRAYWTSTARSVETQRQACRPRH